MSYTKWMFFRVDRCNECSTARFSFKSTSVFIYKNDTDNCVPGKILKFADNTKIYRTVISAEDVSALQSDLSNLILWSKEWQMLFNVDKFR